MKDDTSILVTVFTCSLGCVAVFYFIVFGFLSCSSVNPSTVASINNERDTICKFVHVWKKNKPELSHIDELCVKEATLKEIAAAYAGCNP